MVYFTQTSCPLCYNEETLSQTDIMQTLHIRQYSVCLVLPKSNLKICNNNLLLLKSFFLDINLYLSGKFSGKWACDVCHLCGRRGGAVVLVLLWCSRDTDWTASRQRQLTTSVNGRDHGGREKVSRTHPTVKSSFFFFFFLVRRKSCVAA